MGFLNDLGDFLVDPLDLVDTGGSLAPSNLLGLGDNADDGLDAATRSQQEAADKQLQLGRENLQFLKEQGARAEERLQPFIDYGQPFMDQSTQFINQPNVPLQQAQGLLDPQAQVDFLKSNPIFNAAIENTSRSIGAQGAASGKFGGMVDALFKNYLATGNSFINDRFNQIGAVDALRGNQLNRLQGPVNLAQASAAGQAGNIQNTANQVSVGNQGLSNIYGNIGDINAASAMQAQNIRNQQQQGLFNMLGGGALGASGAVDGLSGLSGGLIAALALSDERAKDIHEYVGDNEDGLPIYRWSYKGDDNVHYGPMAQDVERVNPEAVYTHESGYKMVDMRSL